MDSTASGTGEAHDAGVVTESNVQRLERELEEARREGEREALVQNIENAKTKAEFHAEQEKAAKEAVKDAEQELKDFDKAAKENED